MDWFGGARLPYRPSNSDKEAERQTADRAVDTKESCGREHRIVCGGMGIDPGTGRATDRSPAKCAKEAADDRVSVMVGEVNARPGRVTPYTGYYYVNRISIYPDSIYRDSRVGNRPRIDSRRAANQLLRGYGFWKDDCASGEQQEGDVHATRSFHAKRTTIRILT